MDKQWGRGGEERVDKKTLMEIVIPETKSGYPKGGGGERIGYIDVT